MSDSISRQEAIDFLHQEFIMQIATADESARPAVSVLLFVIDEDLNFYFATHRETHKSKNLLVNPQISIAVWQHGMMLVQADGGAQEVSNDEEKTSIMDRLADAAAKDKDFWPPILRTGGTDYIIFRVTPTWLRALDLSDDSARDAGTPFTQII